MMKIQVLVRIEAAFLNSKVNGDGNNSKKDVTNEYAPSFPLE